MAYNWIAKENQYPATHRTAAAGRENPQSESANVLVVGGAGAVVVVTTQKTRLCRQTFESRISRLILHES